jgi:hypothetical protein
MTFDKTCQVFRNKNKNLTGLFDIEYSKTDPENCAGIIRQRFRVFLLSLIPVDNIV